MTEAIIVAIISGFVTLVGVLIANSKSQAVTETKIEQLTREVREHNNFVQRIPVIEVELKEAQNDIKEIKRRNTQTT